MYGFQDNYRSADPYPRQSRAMIQALDDADDLRGQIPVLTGHISVLEALVMQTKTNAADDAISEAIGHLQDAIAALRCGADKAVDDCDE